MNLMTFEDGAYFYCPEKAEKVLQALEKGFGMYDGWKAKLVAEIVRQVWKEEGINEDNWIELTVKHEGETSHFWAEFGTSGIDIPLRFLDHPKIKYGMVTQNEIWIQI